MLRQTQYLDWDRACLFTEKKSAHKKIDFFSISSRGGLVVELWTDNSLPSATVGSNLLQVRCINRSVEETLCYNSKCPECSSCIAAHT